MVKHTHKNCLSAFDHFVGLALKGLTTESEAQSEPIQTSEMELLAKTLNGFQSIFHTTFAKSSILDVWLVSKYPFEHLRYIYFLEQFILFPGNLKISF